MASNFANNFIASQNSMSRRCDKVISTLLSKFSTFLLPHNDGKLFYVEFSSVSNGIFYVWIYDCDKAPTWFGIRVYACLDLFAVCPVKQSASLTGTQVIEKCYTKGSCDLFPKPGETNIELVDELERLIIDFAMTLVLKKTEAVLVNTGIQYL